MFTHMLKQGDDMNETLRISRAEVTRRVKKIIADAKGRSPASILLQHTLRGDLRFTTPGVRTLTVPINDEFGAFGVGVTPGEVEKCKTVEDVRDLVWENVPENQRE